MLVWLVVEVVFLHGLVDLGCKDLVPLKVQALMTYLERLSRLLWLPKKKKEHKEKSKELS